MTPKRLSHLHQECRYPLLTLLYGFSFGRHELTDVSTPYLSPHLHVRIFWTLSRGVYFDSDFLQKVFCERITVINLECPAIEDDVYVNIEMMHSIKLIFIRRRERNPMTSDKGP